MPSPTIAEIEDPTPFPDVLGDPIWNERRTLPLLTFYGVPIAFLVVLIFATPSSAGRVALGTATVIVVLLLVRARRRSLIESYTLTEAFVSVEQPDGGRVALPTATVERVTIRGDRVRIEASIGVLTLGFVRHQRSLVRALERVVPGVVVEREVDLHSPICTVKY